MRQAHAQSEALKPSSQVFSLHLQKALSNFQSHNGTSSPLAALLKKNGYSTEFIYGGESHFDNMRGFFTGNGFQNIVDEKDFENPVFKGSWGASDEDLLNKTHEQLLAHHKTGNRFSLWLSHHRTMRHLSFQMGALNCTNSQKTQKQRRQIC
jgi:phosphoglycerol transferase MdoB-like AlkP superfamily enzyme